MVRARDTEQYVGAVSDRSDAEILAAAVAELERLDPVSLRGRWRALVGGAMPVDLGRPLTLRVLAYKLQAQRLGDLDKASLRELSSIRGRQPIMTGIAGGPPSPAIDGRERPCPSSAVQPTTRDPRVVRPGTLLTREYGGVLHRVMVLDNGVSWNGKTYDSLSKVAFAITGTKWNGPRFFGLRDPPPGQDADHRSRLAPDAKSAVIGRGRARYAIRSLPQRAPS